MTDMHSKSPSPSNSSRIFSIYWAQSSFVLFLYMKMGIKFT